MSTNDQYLTSKEAKKVLRVSDYHLVHMRLEGKLPLKKEVNTYMYKTMGLEILLSELSNKIIE